MTLSANIVTDLATFYAVDEFAASVVYSPTGGTEKTVSAIVSSDPDNEYRGSDAYGQVKKVRIRSDAIFGVTLPVHGDTVKIGSTSFEVQNVRELNDGLEWELIVSKI